MFPLASLYTGPVDSKACLGVQSHGTGEGSATAPLVRGQAVQSERTAHVLRIALTIVCVPWVSS